MKVCTSSDRVLVIGDDMRIFLKALKQPLFLRGFYIQNINKNDVFFLTSVIAALEDGVAD